MFDCETMSTAQLEKYLEHLKDALEEIEEERMYILSQTGYHLPGATVKKYETEVEETKTKIKEISVILQQRHSTT